RAVRSAASRARSATVRSVRRAAATSISDAGSARPTGCPRSSRATTRTRTARRSSRERLNPGLGAAEDQGVDVVGALVRVDRLEVHDVADHVVLVGDAVAAVHVARGARDVERLAAAVALA